MDFEDFKAQAANYLEDAGIPYASAMDNTLWQLWQQGTKPDQVVEAMLRAQS